MNQTNITLGAIVVVLTGIVIIGCSKQNTLSHSPEVGDGEHGHGGEQGEHDSEHGGEHNREGEDEHN